MDMWILLICVHFHVCEEYMLVYLHKCRGQRSPSWVIPQKESILILLFFLRHIFHQNNSHRLSPPGWPLCHVHFSSARITTVKYHCILFIWMLKSLLEYVPLCSKHTPTYPSPQLPFNHLNVIIVCKLGQNSQEKNKNL